MKSQSEIWHDYMLAAMTSAPDAHPAECAGIADQCLAEYRERWMAAEDAAAARRIIAETTTDQSPPPATPQPVCPPEMREAVALCWALAGGGMQAPTVHPCGKVTLRNWGVWVFAHRVMYALDTMPIARSTTTADAAARENGVHYLYLSTLALLEGPNA